MVGMGHKPSSVVLLVSWSTNFGLSNTVAVRNFWLHVVITLTLSFSDVSGEPKGFADQQNKVSAFSLC